MARRAKYPLKLTNATFSVKIEDENHDESTNTKEMEEAEDDDDDAPVVFLCGRCSCPVGDSLSWDRGEEEEEDNQIVLKRVTDNVVLGKETIFHEHGKNVCGIVHLTCRGCKSLLGMVYISTPKSLDYKRYKFCLNVADIESYVLGSADQQVTTLGPKQEQQPVTLVDRCTVEQQLEEMKSLVLSLANRMTELEANL